MRLPAAVAFPTDDRLLQRIEESRRALPANSVKPLWRSREPEASPETARAMGEPDVEKQLSIKMPAGALDSFRARVEPRNADPCIVPMARPAGAHARARDGFGASAA